MSNVDGGAIERAHLGRGEEQARGAHWVKRMVTGVQNGGALLPGCEKR